MSEENKPDDVEFIIEAMKDGEVRVMSEKQLEPLLSKLKAQGFEIVECDEKERDAIAAALLEPWVDWSGSLEQPKGDDGALVADRVELELVKVCNGCHSISPDDAFRLIQKGWQPIVTTNLSWHQGQAAGLEMLASNMGKLKALAEEADMAEDVGLLVEPVTGAHPFVLCRGHFEDDEWERLLTVEECSHIGRGDVVRLQS